MLLQIFFEIASQKLIIRFPTTQGENVFLQNSTQEFAAQLAVHDLWEIDVRNYKRNASRDNWCLCVYATCMCVGGVVYMECYNSVLVSGVQFITLIFLEIVEKQKRLAVHVKIVPFVLLCVNV